MGSSVPPPAPAPRPPEIRAWRVFLPVFLGIVTVLLTVNWSFYFASPWLENGDAAVNAIQIERAKQGRELLGNYSRFHFNHPGPAFFYAYAAGEIVLTDWLKVCPMPNNAHMVVGLLVQTFFFALALALAARWVQARLFVPLALVAAAVHFGFVEASVTSIWPPHVLLMPFLAFWVATASVACGRFRDLPWAVLAGSFLVHGHVAQPLFVAGLFPVAYWLGWRSRGSDAPAPWRTAPWAHLLGAVLIAVFLLPILIDWSRGPDSNLSDILRHLRYNGGDRKNPLAALLYLVSFAGYERGQEHYFTTLTWGSWKFILARLPFYLAWTAVAAGIVWAVRERFGSWTGLPAAARTAAKLWLGTAGLCVIWGVMQAGPMMDFNGFFYHAFWFVLLLAAAALAAHHPKIEAWFGRRAAWLVLAAVVLALPKFRLPPPPSYQPHLEELLVADVVRDLNARHGDPRQPVFLSFNHRDWPQVATIALTLKRMGVPFYADENWRFMFQDEHVAPVEWMRAAPMPARVWRVVRRQPKIPGVRLNAELEITTAVAPLSPSAGVIDFSNKGNIGQFLVGGLAAPEGEASWTSQPDAQLQFRPLPTDRDVELEIIARPFLPRNRIDLQPTELRFNGHLLFSAPFTEPGVLRVRITHEVWNEHPLATLHLHFPNAQAPSEVGVSSDVRILALAVSKLTTRLAETPRP